MNRLNNSFGGSSAVKMDVAKANSCIDHIINKLGFTIFHTPVGDTTIKEEDMKAILRDISTIQSTLGHLQTIIK